METQTIDTIPNSTEVDSVEPDEVYAADEGFAPLPPRRQKTFGRSSLILSGVLLLSGGFYAGALLKKPVPAPVVFNRGSQGGTGTAAAGTGTGGARTSGTAAGQTAGGAAATAGTSGGAPAAAGTGQAAGGQAAGAAGGRGTRGIIQSVTGANLVLAGNQGNNVKVTTNATTTYAVSKPGAVTDFKAGDSVVIIGASDASGNVTATAVSSSGGGGFGGGGGQGGGAGATGGQAQAGATGGQAAAAGASGGGASGGFGGATRGTVKSVSATAMVVTSSAGADVNVTINGSTTFSVSKPGTLADFKVGDSISVQGAADASGNVTATAISSAAARGANGGGQSAAPATTSNG